jgi:hypothetical protein
VKHSHLQEVYGKIKGQENSNTVGNIWKAFFLMIQCIFMFAKSTCGGNQHTEDICQPKRVLNVAVILLQKTTKIRQVPINSDH